MRIVSGEPRKSILVFGAHPDDIEIGMAGTVARLAAAGNDVVLCIANIPSNREQRMAEAREAARIMGARETIFLPSRSSEFKCDRRTIGIIDSVVRQVEPHTIFTHWAEDSHQDHVALTRCVIAATRKNHFNVLMYEQTIPGGITPAAFRAQYLIDISGFIDQKLDSVRAHASQLARNGEWWVEGVRGRAMFRGYQIHTRYAEAFEIIQISNDTNFFVDEKPAIRDQAAEPLHAVEMAFG